MSLSPPLLQALAATAAALPAPIIAQVATALRAAPADPTVLLQAAQAQAGSPSGRATVRTLVLAWLATAPTDPPATLAGLLEAAVFTHGQLVSQQRVEVVWTGPESTLPLRRTDQALREVIAAAEQRLLIVSFAVYDIPEIAAALVAAAGRGVQVAIIVESPAAGKIAYNATTALGPALRSAATIYHWPEAARPHTPQGKPAALHAKCAVADERVAVVSSANLTHYALTVNMELGVLITGGDVPPRIDQHWRGLIARGVLVAQP